MDEKMREEMISALEKAVRAAGAKNYEDGMRQASVLIEFMNKGIQSMQTIDALRASLDSFPPWSKREEKIALFVLNHLPQLWRYGLKMAAKKAASTLPALSGGRPRATTANETQELLNFISNLHLKGCSLKVAKTRASTKYGYSPRTIERLWSNRGSIPEDEPTIKDALGFISTGEMR